METQRINLVYFSPTNTTKKILEGISTGFHSGAVEHFNLTLPGSQSKPVTTLKDGLAIFGIPVYGGRVPLTALERLRRFHGENTPAAVVVVYGNREFEDALLELKDTVAASGFVPFAGGAFIGEHSFSNEKTPIAHGRPDAADIEQARLFGVKIQERIEALSGPAKADEVEIPGDFPYKKRGAGRNISPATLEKVCTTCGTCASVCPTGAVTVAERVITNTDGCILCSACIKSCPTGARVWESPDIQKAALWLHTDFGKRKEPRIFIGC